MIEMIFKMTESDKNDRNDRNDKHSAIILTTVINFCF